MQGLTLGIAALIAVDVYESLIGSDSNELKAPETTRHYIAWIRRLVESQSERIVEASQLPPPRRAVLPPHAVPRATSFAAGSDLSTECSMPWRYPLHEIVCRVDYGVIVALLRQDDLVSQRTLDLVTTAVTPLHPGLRKRA